jgi:hypothetical protein
MIMEQDEKRISIRPRNNVDVMLRSTQQHQVHLSVMADQKANIIMGAAFLILTVTMNHLQNSDASISLLLLCVFTSFAAFFALMAVMPTTKQKKATASTAVQFNPLFFSFFSQLTLDQYLEKMEKITESDDRVYETIIRDIYQLGVVLHTKKYKYLSYSYRLFIAGLAVSLAAMLIEQIVRMLG